MRVYLIGYMGSGKSTIGKSIAKALGMQWIDLDNEFETRYKITISDFFIKYGESAFRELEQKLLIDFSIIPDIVISTVGGLPCYYNNMELMNETGITVYLKADTNLIISRIRLSGRKRPVFQQMKNKNLEDNINNHLKSRKLYYEKAHITFDASCTDIELLKSKIQNYYNLKNGA